MKQICNTIIRAGLDALYFSGAHRVLRPIFGGVGTIFMLHHVRPAHAGPFQPNRHLEITPISCAPPSLICAQPTSIS